MGDYHSVVTIIHLRAACRRNRSRSILHQEPFIITIDNQLERCRGPREDAPTTGISAKVASSATPKDPWKLGIRSRIARICGDAVHVLWYLPFKVPLVHLVALDDGLFHCNFNHPLCIPVLVSLRN
jgi:hypothetical protein